MASFTNYLAQITPWANNEKRLLNNRANAIRDARNRLQNNYNGYGPNIDKSVSSATSSISWGLSGISKFDEFSNSIGNLKERQNACYDSNISAAISSLDSELSRIQREIGNIDSKIENARIKTAQSKAKYEADLKKEREAREKRK